jgi:hypothetical protein
MENEANRQIDVPFETFLLDERSAAFTTENATGATSP